MVRSATAPEENAIRLELATAEGLAIFHAAETAQVWVSARNPEHLLRGTLIGDEPDRSVTSAYGQTHEVDNFSLAGASVFPTSAAVNPTATLTALALRTADYVRDNRAALLP